jgi:glucose-6-phosphate 1-dehydrogenase
METLDGGKGALRADVKTTDLKLPYGSCLIERPPDACALVIIGASGDLTARKIMPSLYNLYLKKALPDDFIIVGCSRTVMGKEEFRAEMQTAVGLQGPVDRAEMDIFTSRLFYFPLQYEDAHSFMELSKRLCELERRYKTAGNRVVYLAIPPSLYSSTVRGLGEAGLSPEYTDGSGWVRIVVEKPFGRDLDSAVRLDRDLHLYFAEHQIFRIDHYLAKETVQNILMFRFANSIFEPVWNRRYIDRLSIIAAETLGVEHRAGYYEEAGVLRDMFQNHMMQLLALTAMDPPSAFEAERVRDEKSRVYRTMRPFQTSRLWDNLTLGQYKEGLINGEPVVAYRDEHGVDSESLTPTFASMNVFLDNWRWQGVPFRLTSGKRMARKVTEIKIHFKEVPHALFRHTLSEEITANKLTLGIYPEEKISLTFQTKNPGAVVCLRSVNMEFNYHQGYTGPTLEAYEKVLLDCMTGDQTLFWRQDAVELCWGFLTPVLEECEACGDRSQRLLHYEAGSWDSDPGSWNR